MISTKSNSFSHFILKFGIVVYLGLLFLAFFYFKLRIGTLDNAYQVFLLITEKNITIMADRWPAVIVRLIPWFMSIVGAPLDTIMIGFSVSYILFQLFIFFILIITLKRPVLALLQILVLLLACSDGFYWCNSEQIQGLSVVLLTFGILEQKEFIFKVRHIILMIVLFFALLYYHPILLFPIMYLLCFSTVDNFRPDYKMLGAAIFFIMAWYIKNQFFSNWYDVMKSEEFSVNLGQYLSNFWSLESIPQFIAEIRYKYHFVILGAFASLFILIAQKKIRLALYTLVSASLYFIIIIIGTPMIQYSFYTEINFYILILIFYYPILKFLSKEQLNSFIFKLTLTGIILISLARIIAYSENYNNRLNWISMIVEQQNCNKIIVTNEQLNPDYRLQIWSLPYECLILGHRTGINKTLHPFVPQYKHDYKEDIFVTSFKLLDEETINTKYFKFPEGPYCRLQDSQ